jgi:hypothetical protein
MRIVLTRPRDDSERTASALRAKGHDVLIAPLLRVEAVDVTLRANWGGIVITSANAAMALAGNAARDGLIKLPNKKLVFTTNVTDFGKVDPPREVYTMVWVKSAAARDLTLGVGPDDGARVWWNGKMVLDITPCQGTNIDSSTIKVTVNAGCLRGTPGLAQTSA